MNIKKGLLAQQIDYIRKQNKRLRTMNDSKTGDKPTIQLREALTSVLADGGRASLVQGIPDTKPNRDELAAMAMQGDWASQNEASGVYYPEISKEYLMDRAKLYYHMADAMIKVRDNEAIIRARDRALAKHADANIKQGD